MRSIYDEKESDFTDAHTSMTITPCIFYVLNAPYVRLTLTLTDAQSTDSYYAKKK